VVRSRELKPAAPALAAQEVQTEVREQKREHGPAMTALLFIQEEVARLKANAALEARTVKE
jgi:hypothetical protein